jgi:hypothetical protein
MRHLAIAALVGLVALPVAAQVAPPGWSEIVGKKCTIRSYASAIDAQFKQGNEGPYVELVRRVIYTKKITFTQDGGMTFDSYSNADRYTFRYDAKTKTWSGNLGTYPETLTCAP